MFILGGQIRWPLLCIITKLKKKTVLSVNLSGRSRPPESVSMRIHAAKVHETNHFCSLFRVMFHKQLVFHAIFVAKDDIDHVDRSLQCKPDVSILHLIKEHRDPKSPEISRLRKYLKLRHNKPRNHDSKRHKTENKQTTWLNQPMP